LRDYHKKNREQRLEAMREYYQKNRLAKLRYEQLQRQKNRVRIAGYLREYRKKNRDQKLRYEFEYRQKNRERMLEYFREYSQKNRAKKLLSMRKYYQKTREQEIQYKQANDLRVYSSWKSVPEIRNFLHQIADLFDIQNWPEDWYRISARQFSLVGGMPRLPVLFYALVPSSSCSPPLHPSPFKKVKGLL
jgi:hypothetical protein